MRHRIVISGGPGAGKTTLIDALQKQGYATSAEVSRRLIRQQVELQSDLVPWKNLEGFARLALEAMITDFENSPSELTFFDRGIPDIIAYLEVGGLPVSKDFLKAARRYRYHNQVVMTPPWLEIYVNDDERWQSFQEAQELYQAIASVYKTCGYELLELSKGPVNERVTFITSALTGLLSVEAFPAR
ncbi:AAA family ATPase [Siphonobacter sp. SORGH_AS_1065]|uniref:AAA family ATPase n=1 Tax=Siphonobacter sp. SORGH_AS_1065 TaxID=3041795 RepID=UPI0027859990|nr:AAA family ATPase [Siphonobacter sp. SORGH_AS_1065]MDQ1090369.1 putative ATPase [Siphonobacter sp. SORGH_AS_1065]